MRGEARAIVSYLEYKRDADPQGSGSGEVHAALEEFGRKRVLNAPTQASLNTHLKAEAHYVKNRKRE